MPEKPKIAFYWCASCGGCEESVVDLAESILDVAAAVDIVFWPVAMDFKVKDVEAMPDKSILATMINGAIRTSEQEEMAHLLRRKSQYLIAYGSCAHLGGVPALANQFAREEVLDYVYRKAPSVVNPEGTVPQPSWKDNGHQVTLPEFRNVVRALDQVVDVDYYIPGCAPSPKLLAAAVQALLKGELPPKGSVLAPDVALCDECPRKESKPTEVSFKEFKRPHQVIADPNLCFLAQGIICMGPATRSGCGAACISGNMPCTGCYGPPSRVKDQGAKILSSLCANVAAEDEQEIEKILEGIPDPVGTFYRYSLARSLLRRRVDLK
jgi:F420-non-reducing hydrogenase small subunit